MKHLLVICLSILLASCAEQETLVPKVTAERNSVVQKNYRAPGTNRKLKNPIPPDPADPCEAAELGNCGPIGDVGDELFQKIEHAILDGTVAKLFETDQEVISFFNLSEQALTDLRNGVTTLLRVNNVFVVVYFGSENPFNYPSYLNGN